MYNIHMQEVLRSLIHPHVRLGAPRQTKEIWEIWQRQGCHLVGGDLEDTSYVDQHAPSEIVVGGQRSTACVKDHLVALASREDVRLGLIALTLSSPAVFGGNLYEVVSEVERQTGAYINVSDETYTYES